MGTNSTKWDNDAHLNAKTTRELEELLKWWQSPERSQHCLPLINEQIAVIKMKIAERIGRK